MTDPVVLDTADLGSVKQYALELHARGTAPDLIAHAAIVDRSNCMIRHLGQLVDVPAVLTEHADNDDSPLWLAAAAAAEVRPARPVHTNGWPLPPHPESKPAGTSYWGTGEPRDRIGEVVGGPVRSPAERDPLVDLAVSAASAAVGALDGPRDPGVVTVHDTGPDEAATAAEAADAFAALRRRLLAHIETETGIENPDGDVALERARQRTIELQFECVWLQVRDDLGEALGALASASALAGYAARGALQLARLAPTVAWRALASSSAVHALL